MAGSKDHRERVKLRVKDRDRLRAMIDVEDELRWLQRVRTGEIEPTAAQMAANERLLAKTLPNLSSVEITPDAEAFQISDEPLSPAEWAAQHTGETVQ
jgi:hypothetical protein